MNAAPPRLGRYEVGRELGRGGMGVVYEATLVGPGGFRKPVALKLLRDGGHGVAREARLGGLLRHPNLVEVYDLGEVDGTWYQAMELCTGRLPRPLPPRAVVEVGLQVCAGLDHAHRALHLVHLDLKPDNLLLDDVVVKVADLGMARSIGERGRGGTRGYMAPEHVAGGVVDARADIWSLGVLLAELATGSGPASETWHEVEGLPATAPPPCPAWLAPVVDRCTRAEPADRPSSMAEVAALLSGLDAPGPGLAELVRGRPVDAPPSVTPTVPEEPDAFVGRAEAVDALVARLAQPGVLVLHGPAGVGKSRLARAAVRAWSRRQGRPAWWCDLGDAADLGGVLRSVAQALDLTLGAGSDDARVTTVGRALAGRGDGVLVLDTFEAVLAQAPILARWAAAAPRLRVLVTTRVRVALAVEHVPVEPLSDGDAVELLARRAAERGRAVPVDDPLRELATRLDGLPLALELAAARLTMLSASQILARLADRFRLLGRGGADRRLTLEAALYGSWDLLDPTSRTALAQLSVFAGGFTLEAAEGVLDLPEDAPWVLDAIERLVDASLVSPQGRGRFRLLDAVREFAAARLGDDAEPAERRHGAFFATLVGEDLAHRADGPGGLALRAQLTQDADNVLAACRRATRRADPAVAVPTLRAAWVLVGQLASPADHAELASDLLARADLDPRARLAVGEVLAGVAWHNGRLDEAIAAYEALLRAARPLAAPFDLARLLGNHGQILVERGRVQDARPLFEEALALNEASGNRRGLGVTHTRLGILAHRRGDLDEARRELERALTLLGGGEHRRFEGITWGNLAVVQTEQGDPAALDSFERAIAIHHEVGNRRYEASAIGNLALLLGARGEIHEAIAHHLRALEQHRLLGNRRVEGLARGNLGDCYARLGRYDEAIREIEAAIAIATETGDVRSGAIFRGNLAGLHAQEGRFDTAHPLLDEAERSLTAVGDRVELARLHAARAEVAWMNADLERARASLEQARALAPSEARLLADELDQLEARLNGPPWRSDATGPARSPPR